MPKRPLNPMGALPGSSFTDSQRKEIAVFVSNSIQQAAEELLKTFEEALRETYGHLVANGCLVQAGVDRIAAAQEARKAAEAASVPPEPSRVTPGQSDGVAGTIVPHVDVTIQ
jgi:hypothetical protein